MEGAVGRRLPVDAANEASNSRKALLILSDGGDNNSRYTEAEMKALVREGDVCIYAMRTGDFAPDRW